MKQPMDIIRDFHPNTKPVLWRILLAQLCLYQALKKINNDKSLKISKFESFDKMYESFNDICDIDPKQISWAQEVIAGKDYYEPRDNNAFDSVRDYLESKFRDIYDTQKFQIVENGIENDV